MAALPAAALAFRSGAHYEAVVAVGVFVSSLLYHAADTLNARLFRLNEGQVRLLIRAEWVGGWLGGWMSDHIRAVWWLNVIVLLS